MTYYTAIRPKFGIPMSPQSPDIERNSVSGFSDFRISGHFLVKEHFITPEVMMMLS